jgi:alanine-synthesizing transaminase
VKLRRVDELPDYVFATVREETLRRRRAGVDVVDLSFGNPDLPSPEVAVHKLAESARDPRNHRYSASRGLPRLRQACAALYRDDHGVTLDPDTEVVATMGAKEALTHLLWTLLDRGDSAIVPDPAYPIHDQAVRLAGATTVPVPLDTDDDELCELVAFAATRARPRPRVLLISFPNNPTTRVADRTLMQRIVEIAQEQELFVVHDFAYADLCFDGYRAPSILSIPGARDVAVEITSLSKGFSMAGWRVGFVCGNATVVSALARLKSWLDYGTFQPIQIAAITALEPAREYREEVRETYRNRRDTLCRGLARIGWNATPPRATMFVWAPIPEQFAAQGSLAFSHHLLDQAAVAVSPGIGFGPAGEHHVRFALVENEHRLRQAVRSIARTLERAPRTA